MSLVVTQKYNTIFKKTTVFFQESWKLQSLFYLHYWITYSWMQHQPIDTRKPFTNPKCICLVLQCQKNTKFHVILTFPLSPSLRGTVEIQQSPLNSRDTHCCHSSMASRIRTPCSPRLSFQYYHHWHWMWTKTKNIGFLGSPGLRDGGNLREMFNRWLYCRRKRASSEKTRYPNHYWMQIGLKLVFCSNSHCMLFDLHWLPTPPTSLHRKCPGWSSFRGSKRGGVSVVTMGCCHHQLKLKQKSETKM